MATDYKKIKEENSKNPPINYRSIFTPYSDKTHFVYELVQNADDNISRCAGLQLCENGLIVWNDGCKFSEEDVRSICSIGFSNKDLTQIGTFGMGFKSVYTYTDIPEVYSGDERFRIPIKNPTIPEGIDVDKINAKVVELLEKGNTVFWLPFRESMRPEIEIKRLRDCLRNLEKRSLLFLRNLKMVQWHDESDRQEGIYSCQRSPYKKIQNASKVDLKASVNGNDQPSEIFLVFRKEVQPPQEVIIELQQLSEDEDERHRIQRSADKLQPIEVAFYLKDGEIKEMGSCVLFAYLPTRIRTDLRFIIQARYQTTLARNDIQMDSPWNRWLVQETANFLPEILEQLKISGLLKPTFFNVLPLKGDVENEFKPIAEALQKAMQERAFVPTQSGGYAKAENVFYPHRESLRELVDCDLLYSNSSWLHPEIRDTEEFRQCFKAMREAGVSEIGINQVLDWLEKQESNWFESKCEDWLRALYLYLNSQKSELQRIKKLPLVRLENGKHVSATDRLVFFPPDSNEEREEIAPFLKELPILMSGLLEGDNSDEIEAFLKKLGVRTLNPEDIINESICPKYLQSEKPSLAQNRLHVRYLFKVWDKISNTEIKKKISETPILLAYKTYQRDILDYVKPCETYLSKVYADNDDLETYYSVSDCEIWFVDDAYMEDDSNRKDWLKFLKTIGFMNKPKIVQRILKENLFEECTNLGIRREDVTISGEEIIENYYFHGLSTVLYKIRECKSVKLSQVLWGLLVKLSQVSEKDRNTLFKGNYNWRYRFNTYSNSQPFDATFYRQLKETTWLPDEQGNLHRPSKCFAPTSENRRHLGDSVTYLHPDFDISQDNEPARWLADKLGVNLNANTDSVMNYLKTLSGSTTNIKDIVPLYRYLDDYRARRQKEFKAESLIFTPEPEPSWWQADKVFWEDESAVFGNDRGYLKEYYPENLKSFFSASGVSERAAPLDYVRGIQDVTSTKNVGEEEVHNRVRILYSRLWGRLQEGGSFLEDEAWQKKWEETREGKCWLGKKGNGWGFFYSDELVWEDDDYRSRLFKDETPFWGFDNDLLEFAESLDVKGCYQSSDVEFDHYGNQGEFLIWSKKVKNLRLYIHNFLHSPSLCKGYREKKTAEVLNHLSVCQAQELKVRYKLKGISVPDPNPRQSFLEVMGQRVVLWIGLKEDEKAYPDLIGDALQDYFGIDQLREFVKDLLMATDSYIDETLLSWVRRGFQTNLCLSSPETEWQGDEVNSTELVDEKLPRETSSEHDVPEMIEPKVETPVPHEVPQTNSRDENSENDETETPTYPQSTNWTSQSGGHRRNTSNRGSGRGGFGGGGEGEKHQYFKDYLADNPSLFGEKLKLVNKEYRFKSGDESDILLEDSSGKPVTVEVKPPISSGSDQEVWQAVKYKHLAAVEYGLQCNQVRSILVAPEIPDDVKEKCKKFGIEPIEVPLPNNTRNSKS